MPGFLHHRQPQPCCLEGQACYHHGGEVSILGHVLKMLFVRCFSQFVEKAYYGNDFFTCLGITVSDTGCFIFDRSASVLFCAFFLHPAVLRVPVHRPLKTSIPVFINLTKTIHASSDLPDIISKKQSLGISELLLFSKEAACGHVYTA